MIQKSILINPLAAFMSSIIIDDTNNSEMDILEQIIKHR